jgi:hypothetical protein
MPVRKWTAPVRLGFANPGAAPSLVDLSKHGVCAIAAEAGIAVIDFENAASSTISSISTRRASTARPLLLRARRVGQGLRDLSRRAAHHPMRLHGTDRCAVREGVHSFGFP